MNKVLLQKVTREEFEKTIGNNFGTIGTVQGSVISRYPTWEHSGRDLHSIVNFATYEEYLEYIK